MQANSSQVQIPAITIRNLSKHFTAEKFALKDVSLSINPGEMIALVGSSGAGKSTLLRHISGLVVADPGASSQIKVLARVVQENGKLSSNIRAVRSEVGLIFQQFNLVSRLSVLTNVLTGLLHQIPLWRSLFGYFNREEKVAALNALARVGIKGCALQRASTLSGGQQQRAAVARAIVQRAKILLADEPISSLDPESSRIVMELLSTLNQEDGCTVLVSLHQVNIAKKYCKRVIAMRSGEIVFDGATSELTPELLRELYGSKVGEILDLEDNIAALEEPVYSAPKGVHPNHLVSAFI